MENSLIAKNIFFTRHSILYTFASLNSKFFTRFSAFITFLEGREVLLHFISQMET